MGHEDEPLSDRREARKSTAVRYRLHIPTEKMTSFIVHSNNYYWVDLVVSNADALVTFESELPSDLPNPQFIARAGATNRVVLLLGKPYEVKCALYVGDTENVRFALTGVGWDEVDSILLSDVKTTDGEDLHSANFRQNGLEGWSEVGCVLPDGFVSLADESSGVVAMEFGRQLSRLPLALAVRLKGTHEELYRFELPVDIYDVESLFRMVNLAGVCGDDDSADDCPAHGFSPSAVDESDTDVVFVHGYNMAPREARAWAQAMFKRLWCMGMNARFTAVTWRGNETQAFVPGAGYVTRNYYQNVLNAFRTAPSFAQTVNALPGTHKFVIAHSLGNMLVSAAAQFHGLTYDKYFMLNAAIAREAFDPVGGITPDSHDAMTPETWMSYPDRVRATHWYDLFPQGDGRRLLTWKGIFSSVGNVINYYSREDEVLRDGDGSFELLGREFAWYNQETRKGYFPYVADNEAGWEFNPQYDVESTQYIGGTPLVETRHLTGTEANALTDEQLKTRPFFSGFRDEAILSSSNGIAVASNMDCCASALAYGIPSESFAVGTGAIGVSGSRQSVDMKSLQHDSREFRSSEMKWTHSFFLEKPLIIVKDLYMSMIDLINRKGGSR